MILMLLYTGTGTEQLGKRMVDGGWWEPGIALLQQKVTNKQEEEAVRIHTAADYSRVLQ